MPVVALAVAVTLAIPEALVVAVSDDSVALAPEPAVHVTTTPETGLLEPSRTVTCSAVPKAVDTTVDCVEPPVATMLAGAPTVLVRLKVDRAGTPAADAVTA